MHSGHDIFQKSLPCHPSVDGISIALGTKVEGGLAGISKGGTDSARANVAENENMQGRFSFRPP